MAEISDQQLIENFRGGDHEAFAVLVKRYLPMIYGISLRYLKDTDEAQDAVQDIYVKLWKNLNKFETDRNFGAWAGRIAKNTCLDVLKKRQVIPFSAFETEAGENPVMDGLTSKILSPFHLAERASIAEGVQKVIKKLSPAYQKIIALYYERGLNFREIAEETGEPLDTVKSRHRRAVIILKKHLSDF